MSTPSRTAGMYGRRPPKRAPAIRFAHIRNAAAPPAPPAAVDYLSPLGGGWQMLGNDSQGDCVAVWWANTRRVISTVLGPTAVPPVTPGYPDLAQVETVYATQNPGGADNGMDIQTLLEFLVANPGFGDGGKLLGFAAVDFTNATEVQAAIDAGGVLCIGINVQQAQQDQFGADQPWDWVPGSPLDGGHCVAVGGYGAAPAGSDPAMAGDEKFITWAAETSFTDNYWANGVEELWFLIWEEQLGTAEFQAGVDLAAFAAEYTAITGRPFPVTVTPPSPPGPVPTPVDVDAADQALWRAVKHWAREPHMGGNAAAAHAVMAWAVAKGLTG